MTVCSKVLPYLSADIQKVTELYISKAIHGGGNANTNPVFNSEINFAIGRLMVEGTVSVEVFGGTGNYATAFTNILNRAIPTATDMSTVCNGFDSNCQLIFSPGGGSEVVLPASSPSTTKCLVNSLELRGNPGGNVQASFKLISAGADYNNSNTNKPAASDLAFETAGTTDDSNPVPYYASNFTVTGSGETGLSARITDWNLTVNNNCTPIFVFNGTNYAVDIILGMREVTGSFSYYSDTGTFVETLTHGATCTITFGSTTLNMPFLAFERNPSPPSPGPNAPTIRTINFRGMAASSVLPSIYKS